MNRSDPAERRVESVTLVPDILAAIEAVLRDTDFSVEQPLSLHEPSIGENEERHVRRCLEHGWISSAGPYVEEFEQRLAEVCGVHKVVACVNGTAALHLSLLVSGVQPGDEVLVPAISFVATANAVCYCGALPHFVDVSEEDFGIDPVRLVRHLASVAERRNGGLYNVVTGRRIAALLPVHCFGYPCAVRELQSIAGARGIPMVEDAAEAFGSRIGSQAAGSFGLLGALSFNGNKLLTTGGGGAVLSNDIEAARRAKHLSTTAKLSHPWAYVHDELGYNYRLPSLNAALGIGQLERLHRMLVDKQRLHEAYRKAFDGIDGVRLLEGGAGCTPNHWLNTLVLAGDSAALRDALLQEAHACGLLLRPVWHLLPDLAHFSGSPQADLSVANSLVARTVNLPSSSFLAPP